MEQGKKKQLMVGVIAIVLLIVATVGVTYAFFNYTRTGMANTVSVGRIAFNSSQSGTINLTNIFPIDPTETGIMNDATKVGTVAITVTGDTSYDKGVEYLVSAVNVNNAVGTKTIPISISATASGTLGTSDENYFDDRDTATSHIYKVLAKDTISEDDQLMVGYIANNATGINGTITIKAYIDKNNIAISDTYNSNGTTTDTNGTTSNWVNGRTVFTTTEWNSLQGTGVSFQVKVEANEGIWVIDKDRNDMKAFTSEITSVKSSITEINFIKMSEEEINTHVNLIDLTADNGNGMVKAWIENNKLYVASPGTTYFPESSSNLFGGFSNVTSIDFNNVNTTNVTNMHGMFLNCYSLTSLNLSNLGGDNLSDIEGIFAGCTNLKNINMSNFNFGQVQYLAAIFSSGQTAPNVEFVDLSNARIGIASADGMFYRLTKLIEVDLSGINTNNITGVSSMFADCSSLTSIYVSNDWNINDATEINSYPMFLGCTSLKGGGTPQTAYDANHTNKEYARIDGGANSSTPGYLTLKTY